MRARCPANVYNRPQTLDMLRADIRNFCTEEESGAGSVARNGVSHFRKCWIGFPMLSARILDSSIPSVLFVVCFNFDSLL